MFIKTEGYFKSEFDSNYKDYGYHLDENNEWFSDITNYQQALALAEEFNSVGLYNENTPSSWLLFGLLSYGFSLEELRSVKIKDLHWPSMLLKKYKLIRQYKELLFKEIRK